MTSKSKVSKKVLKERNQNLRIATHQSDSFFSKPFVAYIGLLVVCMILIIALSW